MDIQKIAEWMIAHPQAWFQLSEFVAEKNPDYARQIGVSFLDSAEDRGAYDDEEWLRDIDDPGEQQEWRDFDPDC